MNHAPIALAGMAEIALRYELTFLGAIIFAIAVAACLALVLKSRATAIVATTLLVFFTALLQPWSALLPLGAGIQEDPDVASLANVFHVIAVAWLVACILVALALRKTWPPARFF
jgi:hypothetical protein